MKSFLILLGVLAFPAAATAQTPEMIERALTAAPARAREATTVIKWNADHSYAVIKQGTNTQVCYDRSGEPGRPEFSVQCTSLKNLDRIAQNRRFAAASATPEAMNAMVAAAEADHSRVLPEYGSVWNSMDGRDAATARIHRTIAIPGATSASTGLPESGAGGGAWIMDAGKTSAHIMTPGG